MEAAMTETEALSALEAGLSATTISAEEIHRFLLLTHKIQARTRRLHLEGLLRVEEHQLYSLLGSPDIYAYSLKHFHRKPTATAEALRAARALRSLPLTLEALDAGKLAYSRVLEVTKVASAATEADWIDLAQRKSLSFLRSEVRDAKEKGRDHPRKDGRGLPGIKVKVSFDLAPEEHEMTRVVIDKVARELSRSLGGEHVDPKTAFLFIIKRYLETEPGETPEGRYESLEPPTTILYHQCPDCRKSHVATPDGLEEVDAAVVERAKGEAEELAIDPAEEVPGGDKGAAGAGAVEIDPPNTPRLTRRVLLRDLLRCGNPHCGRNCGLHAHHIRWRCHGGKTALWNEVAVCIRCHSLIHLGLLSVTVGPDDTLRWVAKGDALDFALGKDVLSSALDRAAAAFTYVKEPGRAPEAAREAPPEALADLEALVGGLERLGFGKREARERLIEAHRRLSEGGKPPTEEEVVKEALRKSVPRNLRTVPAA
jgi:hypothetical protein